MQARLTGAIAKNPQRYRNKIEPKGLAPLGEAPEYLRPDEKSAWNDFALRLPWLNRSHRGITGIACHLSAKMAAGTLGVPGMNLLRMTLGQMGATPASAQHGIMPDDDVDDLAEAHFR